MSDARTVSAVILDLLASAGIDTCFGIPGVHNLGFWNALTPDRPRVIGVRHEQAAGYACDGLYRSTGRVGAALLTSGPGAANILAAFGEATMAYSPMMVISSDVGTRLRRPGVTRGILHEMRDQAGMFGAFGSFARNSTDAADAIANVVAGIERTLTAPSQPVYVGVPADVLEEEWTGPLPTMRIADDAQVDPDALQGIVELIEQSPRIVMWLGGGVVASATEAPVRELAERLGAVVVTSFAGRGLMAGHPQAVEIPVHEPEVCELIASADLLLVVGSDFDAMNTKNWRMVWPQRTAVISLGDQVGQTLDWDVRLPADLRAALPALRSALEAAGVAARVPWRSDAAAVRGQVFARLATDARVAPALAFVDAIEQGWSPDDAVVCDMAVAGFWTALYSAQSRPRRVHYPVGWGTLGYGMPAAMGPASQGVATLSVCGDGGPMFALGELATFAQESLPITLLIVDDGGYGMLRFDQQVFGHPERGVDLLTPDWVSLAGSFGITGVDVADVTELAGELRDARKANGRGEPRVIVWRQRLFPPRTTSPRWSE